MANQAEKLFDKLYAAGQDVIDAARKPLAERQLKRKFQTAYDNVVTTKLESELAVQSALENMKDYNLQRVLEAKAAIKDADYTMEQIAAHYAEMFGESLVK